MNTNKKILNPKNNSPWLLCPSKSFPGKFYYFNGSTGETAWCLSETDKHLKKVIHRVADKSHTYPEPFGPPIDDSTNTTNSFTSLNNGGNTGFQTAKEIRPSPVFGQAVFPKYVPTEIFAPNFVWTLTPMYVPSQLPCRQMLDQITQTYERPIFMPNNFQPIKSSEFTPNSFPFGNPMAFQHQAKPTFDKTVNFNFKSNAQTSKPSMKDEACQTFVPTRSKRQRTQSESEYTPKSVLKSSRSVENLSTLFSRDIETSTLSPSHRGDENGKLSELDKNDLRFKLVAKKRKVESSSEADKTMKSTDRSNSKIREAPEPKKRVTFDLEESEASHSISEVIQDVHQSPESCSMEDASRLAPDGITWYVVADTAALLEDLQCIEEFVKSDGRCRLLVPHAVRAELEARSRGDSGAVAARHLLRKLAAHDTHIVVQSESTYELSSEDSILECCWNLLQDDCHVILVTNNENMSNKAKSIDLDCYTLDDIKQDNHTYAEAQIHQEQTTVLENDNKKSENLFMQNLNEIYGFCLTKPNGFKIREARLHISDKDSATNYVFSKKDNNTDKLINLTRPKNNVNMVQNLEVGNVKDQIRKLNIAEPKSVHNRTKQIVKNAFWNTGIDNNTDQNIISGLENHNNKPNTDKNDLDIINQNIENVFKTSEIIDEIDRDIRKLNVTEHNIEKSKDAIKISGITKLNNQYNLDEELERFNVKNAVVENRIKSRLEEWACRLNQTMEGVLTEMLLKEKVTFKRMMPPWNLFEAIQVTGETFKKQYISIKSIIDNFSMKLLNCSSSNGKLNKDLKPNDFMKLVGFSFILIRHLKDIVDCTELYEADDMLVDLIKNIEDPKTDIDLSLEKAITPVFSRSEISDLKDRVGFKKSQKEIVQYLKKHFPEWQNETNSSTNDVINDKTVNKEPNILRTCGKDLKSLKINNTKTITVENKNADIPNINNQPKVIRNVKIIEAFEERLKKKAELDLNELDYEESQTAYTVSSEDDNEDFHMNDEEERTSNVPGTDIILDDLSVSESSVNTECIRAYPLAKIFLVKLKVTLTTIFNFAKTSIQEFKEGMCMEKKADALLKTELTRQYLLKITGRLKNIIARESGDGLTLKDLLIKAGDYSEHDAMMNNYSQMVTKFLEQTQILEEVLQHMISLLKTVSKKEKEDTYNNSLNTSPILPTRTLRSNTVCQAKI